MRRHLRDRLKRNRRTAPPSPVGAAAPPASAQAAPASASAAASAPSLAPLPAPAPAPAPVPAPPSHPPASHVPVSSALSPSVGLPAATPTSAPVAVPPKTLLSAAGAPSRAQGTASVVEATIDATNASVEEVPIVRRYFVDSASGGLSGGDSVYAYLASDLYLKRIAKTPTTWPGGKKKKPLCTLIDFRGCEEPILLRRLADGNTMEAVKAAVTYYEETNPEAAASPCPGLRVSGAVREAGTTRANLTDIVLLFSPGFEDLCSRWVSVLQSRVKPLALRRQIVLESFSQPCPPNSARFLKDIQTLYDKEDREQDRKLGGREGPEGKVSAAAITERSEAYMRRLACVSEKVDLAKSTAEGIVNVISGSDVADAVARVLGGVTLVGPVVSVASMCVCISRMVAQAEDDREALRDLCERVPRIAHQLSKTLFLLLRASCSSKPLGILDGTFDSIENCWRLFNEAERFLLKKKRGQFFLAEHAARMKEAAANLEISMQFALRDERIAVNALDIQEVRATVANLDLSEGQQSTALIAPPAPGHVVREAIPDYEALRDSLLSGGTTILSDASRAREQAAVGRHGLDSSIKGPQLVGDTLNVSVSAVDGDGGYGKTTCLLLLANDRLIQGAFSYVVFMQLGPSAQDSAIVRELVHFAKVIGPASLAESIDGVPAGANQVLQVVNRLRPRLANARTLLILDNVWQRQAERQWVAELSALVSGGTGSSVLVSTRSGDLAACADEGRRFTVGRVMDKRAAQRIIEIHAGLEPGASKPQGSDGCHVSECDEAEYGDVMALMLGRCDGWHLALGMCGALAKLRRFRWASIGRNLRDKLVEMPSMFATRDVRHPGLQAIIETNLEAAQEMLSELAFALEFSTAGDRQTFESVDLRTLFSRLAICDATRKFPYYCLGPLFGMSQSCGEEIGALFEKAGLAKTKGNASGRVLWVHDLQHASAELLCKAADGDGAVATVHRAFLQSCAEHFATDAESVALGERNSWSRVCERVDAAESGEYLATYVCDNLVRHLVESSRDESGALRIEWRRDDLGILNVESECLRLLCSYEWVRARGHKFGRAAVVRDFAVLVDAVHPDRGELHAGTDHVLGADQRGTHYALQACLKVLLLIGAERFNQDMRGDSGLAGELYGRLAVNKFQRVDEAARPYARHVAAMLQSSIRESARPPWLCPRNECYLSQESNEDERCVAAFSASGGEVGGVAYVRVGGESALLSGGAGGSLWVHDARDPGGAARELTGHGERVTSVVAAGRGAGGAADNVLAASCSDDGTVRLWGCKHGAAKGELRSLQTLETSDGRELCCVDLTPDAARVVIRERDQNCVHVWTRRSAGGAAAARGADEYAAIALSGHTKSVVAVRVSRTGERVVSASLDGTVRVWRVAMDAADGPSHNLVSWAEHGWDKNHSSTSLAPRQARRHHSPSALALAADARTVYVADRFRSDIALVDCDWESAREVATLRSDIVRSGALFLALLESRGGGASGRLFAGHRNGVISEWDLEARTCSAVYGDARSRAGFVSCITARFLEQASDGGDAVACSESTRTGPRVTSAAAGTGSGALCGAGQSRVEFAAAYNGGAVRVWRASSGYGSGETSAAEAGAGVGEREVERHDDTPDDCPVSLAASGDGRWLVSGSQEGVLCVWDTGSGACVATLRGHEERITGIDVSGDGTVFASCSADGSTLVWKLQSSREWLVSANLDHEEARVTCVVMTVDALHAVTGDRVGHVRVWNASTGELCMCGRDKHSAPISSLAVFKRGAAPRAERRSGANLVFASRDRKRTCVLWSLFSGGDLACEKEVSEVPQETDLGNVFSCAELAPLPALWHERRGCCSTANHFVFGGGGRGGARRYEVSARYRTDLRVVESKNDSRSSVGLDSAFYCVTCFQRQEDGHNCLVVCCGLANGKVAIFDLIPPTPSRLR